MLRFTKDRLQINKIKNPFTFRFTVSAVFILLLGQQRVEDSLVSVNVFHRFARRHCTGASTPPPERTLSVPAIVAQPLVSQNERNECVCVRVCKRKGDALLPHGWSSACLLHHNGMTALEPSSTRFTGVA